MKKLLSIIVLGLLFSGNAYADSENLYLSCPRIITEDNSKNMKEGHILTGKITEYYYFKIQRKKTKVKIKVYSHTPKPGENYQEKKPDVLLDSSWKDSPASYENGSYSILYKPIGFNNIHEYFTIYKDSNSWVYKGHTLYNFKEWKVDFKHEGDCEKHLKKEFKKLLKNF